MTKEESKDRDDDHGGPSGTLRVEVGDSDSCQIHKTLRFCLFGCEEKPPYGPTDHTSDMFLGLIRNVVQRYYPETFWDITMDYFTIQSSMDSYPTSYGVYDGVIVPGSYNSAYDANPWIERLKQELQQVLVPQDVPVLGVCFGHQVLAHSYDQGQATKCPAGPQGGGRVMECTETGTGLLGQTNVSLLYTHGDMVQQLPPHASALGGNDRVPIQSAVYYSSSSKQEKIAAVTFQAHPEYASEGPYQPTLRHILHEMVGRGDLDQETAEQSLQHIKENWQELERDSFHVILQSGIALGWFPDLPPN